MADHPSLCASLLACSASSDADFTKGEAAHVGMCELCVSMCARECARVCVLEVAATDHHSPACSVPCKRQSSSAKCT